MDKKDKNIIFEMFSESVKKADMSCLEMIRQKCKETADKHREEFETVNYNFKHGAEDLDKEFQRKNNLTKNQYIEKLRKYEKIDFAADELETEEEREECRKFDQHRIDRSKVYKDSKAAVKEFESKNLGGPFDKMACILTDLSGIQMRNTQLGVKTDLTDELDKMPQYSIEDKMMTVFYLREYMKDVAVKGERMNSVKDPEQKEQLQQEIYEFNEKFSITKKAEQKGKGEGEVKDMEAKPDALSPSHNSFIATAKMMFNPGATKKTPTAEDTKNMLGTYKNAVDFCNQSINRLQTKILRENTEIKDIPYYQSEDFKKDCEMFQAGMDLVVQNKQMAAGKLSFGRKGSDQYNKMSVEYEKLVDKITKYSKEKSPEKLDEVKKSIKQLEEYADLYIGFKNDQMKKGKIGSKKMIGKDGNEILMPTKSVTLKRVENAYKIKEMVGSLNQRISRMEEPAKQNEVKNPGMALQ